MSSISATGSLPSCSSHAVAQRQVDTQKADAANRQAQAVAQKARTEEATESAAEKASESAFSRNGRLDVTA